MKIIDVIRNDHSRTCQIQQEAVIPDESVQTQQPTINAAQNRTSQVPKQHPKGRIVSSNPIPDQIKHKLIQDRLTKQFMRQSNIIKPTTDDIEIARDRVTTQLKRSDLDYQRRIDRVLRRRSRENID